MSFRDIGVVSAVVALAAGVYLMWFEREPEPVQSAPSAEARTFIRPVRPERPPVLGRDRPRSVPEPRLPPNAQVLATEAYEQAVTEGAAQPGEKAFRATVDAFIEYNMSFAEAQAQEEGITVDEVRELTYFGFMAMQTQRWSEVEDILGRELDDDERAAGEALMHDANREFKAAMRELVAEGAGEEARWQLIRDTQARYKEEYLALTGMTPTMLDDLLAGDITRTGAPIATPPPENIPPGPEYVPPEPRPDQTPR